MAGKAWNSDQVTAVSLPCPLQVSCFLPPMAWERQGQARERTPHAPPHWPPRGQSLVRAGPWSTQLGRCRRCSHTLAGPSQQPKQTPACRPPGGLMSSLGAAKLGLPSLKKTCAVPRASSWLGVCSVTGAELQTPVLWRSEFAINTHLVLLPLL